MCGFICEQIQINGYEVLIHKALGSWWSARYKVHDGKRVYVYADTREKLLLFVDKTMSIHGDLPANIEHNLER